MITGILRPDSGDMFVDGQHIAGINGHFSYMPQNDLLFPWKTILENVCLYGRIHGSVKQAREKAKSLFPAFGLEGYENAYPHELSGGMRQRAAFLRTALCGADILLLDEPFGALDVISRGSMQDWLCSMKFSLNRTVLLVTHDVDEAIYLSDRVYILGGKPTGIVREIVIPEKNRTRDWLFDQTDMRRALHACIRGEGPGI
jgi:ABC-type nitrate/sulfonate/bicarbonate transport system ATPase subunit